MLRPFYEGLGYSREPGIIIYDSAASAINSDSLEGAHRDALNWPNVQPKEKCGWYRQYINDCEQVRFYCIKLRPLFSKCHGLGK